MVLTIDGTALDDYPSSINPLLQHHLHLKENSTRLTAEKTQVLIREEFFYKHALSLVGLQTLIKS